MVSLHSFTQTLLFTILLALLAHAAEYVSERAKGCLDAN